MKWNAIHQALGASWYREVTAHSADRSAKTILTLKLS